MRSAHEVCNDFRQLTGVSLNLAALVKFLAKLDRYGILANNRAQDVIVPESSLSQTYYVRFKHFNPDTLFTCLVPKLRWIWTMGFFVVMTTLIVLALLLVLMSASKYVHAARAFPRYLQRRGNPWHLRDM